MLRLLDFQYSFAFPLIGVLKSTYIITYMRY
ncbi:hypothetical protein VPHK469_0065 [Vibrio phage K469]